MSFLNYMNKPEEEKKDYTFLFQNPEEYEVKVNEEGEYLTDLDSIEIPEYAFDSGEDISNTFMGNDVTNSPYVIGGSSSEEFDSIPYSGSQLESPMQSNTQNYDMIDEYNTDLHIPDAEHVLDYEPSYRDYLNDSEPSIEQEEDENIFNYDDYYDKDEQSFEYSDKMKSSDEEEYDEEYEEEEDSEEDEYIEDEDEEFSYESEEDEEEEEEDEEKEIKKNKGNFKMNKEVKEAISYIETYSSMKNKDLSLHEKIKCLSEAGYNKTIINTVISEVKTNSNKKVIKEVNRNPKLNKFIENNQSRILKEIGKQYGLSLKEQKLFEDLAGLNNIVKNFYNMSIRQTQNTNTYKALSEESKQQYNERMKIVSGIVNLIPVVYEIATASFVMETEENKEQTGQSEQNQQGQGQTQKQSFKRKDISLRIQEAEGDDYVKVNQYWIDTETKLKKFETDIFAIKGKIEGEVSSLKAVGNLVGKGAKNLYNLLGKGISSAKNFIKKKAQQVKGAYDKEIQGQQAQISQQNQARKSRI